MNCVRANFSPLADTEKSRLREGNCIFGSRFTGVSVCYFWAMARPTVIAEDMVGEVQIPGLQPHASSNKTPLLTFQHPPRMLHGSDLSRGRSTDEVRAILVEPFPKQKTTSKLPTQEPLGDISDPNSVRQTIIEYLWTKNYWVGKNGFPSLPNYMRLVFGMPEKAMGNIKHTNAITWGITVYEALLVFIILELPSWSLVYARQVVSHWDISLALFTLFWDRI